MTYQDIPGWFTWEPLYKRMVDLFPSGSTFVEIGTYLGKSACYMAQQIKESGKQINFICIDPWNVPVSGNAVPESGSWFPLFWNNVQAIGLEDYIKFMQMRNEDALSHFNIGTVEFVFIDAEHDYKSVTRDVDNWGPIVTKGGILAGHDYTTNQDTKRAVDSYFSGGVNVEGECWWVQG